MSVTYITDKKKKNKKIYKNYERYTFCSMPDIKIILICTWQSDTKVFITKA